MRSRAWPIGRPSSSGDAAVSRRGLLVLVACCLGTVLPACLPFSSFSGEVVEVADGDVVGVQYLDARVWVRLHGVDCPDPGQAYGPRAKQITGDLAMGQRVKVELVTRDGQGRFVGDILLPGGGRLNETLVDLGACWWDRRAAPDDRRLHELEEGARQAKRGLWTDPNPLPPWEYRMFRGGGP